MVNTDKSKALLVQQIQTNLFPGKTKAITVLLNTLWCVWADAQWELK